MRKTIKSKGFTLVECIVAMAILGVTSLLICQAYSQMMRITRENNNIYQSLSDQMKNVENRNETNSKLISGDAVHAVSGGYDGGREFTIYKADYTQAFDASGNLQLELTVDASGEIVSDQSYLTHVDVYLANPYHNHTMLPADTDEVGSDVRFVYFYNKKK